MSEQSHRRLATGSPDKDLSSGIQVKRGRPLEGGMQTRWFQTGVPRGGESAAPRQGHGQPGSGAVPRLLGRWQGHCAMPACWHRAASPKHPWSRVAKAGKREERERGGCQAARGAAAGSLAGSYPSSVPGVQTARALPRGPAVCQARARQTRGAWSRQRVLSCRRCLFGRCVKGSTSTERVLYAHQLASSRPRLSHTSCGLRSFKSSCFHPCTELGIAKHPR